MQRDDQEKETLHIYLLCVDNNALVWPMLTLSWRDDPGNGQAILPQGHQQA